MCRYCLQIRSFTISFFTFLLLLNAACGGGGGGGSDVAITDDPAPLMPAQVEYVAGSTNGDPGTTGLALQDGALSVSCGFYLEGSYVPAEKTYSLSLSPVARLVMTVSGQDFSLPVADALGSFTLQVEETLQWRFGNHPTAGSLLVASGNFIRGTVNPDVTGTGAPGIDIEFVEFGVITASASLTWPQFDTLLNNDAAPAYQRQLALAYSVMQRVFQPLHRVVENFAIIRQQENALEAAGPGQALSVPVCSIFNGIAGNLNLSWLDGPGDIANALGPGDHFVVDATNCWLNDTSTPYDLMLVGGELQLQSYGESTTPFTLGFDQVVVDNLEIARTEQTGSNTGTVLDSTLFNSFSTVTGRTGFYLVLTPDVSGTLNLVNLVEVGGAAARVIGMPGELGAFATGLLADAIASGLAADNVGCPVSGSYDYQLSALPFASGESMVVAFHDCVQGSVADPTRLNGGYTLTATAFTSSENLAVNLLLQNVAIQDTVDTLGVDGPLNFSRIVTAGVANEISSAVSGQSLDFSQGGLTASLAAFSLTGSHGPGGLTLGLAGEIFTLTLSSLADPLDGVITAMFSGLDLPSLEAGAMRVTAADGSNLLLTITDASGAVTLALDSDGNGSAEDVINTFWDDLY